MVTRSPGALAVVLECENKYRSSMRLNQVVGFLSKASTIFWRLSKGIDSTPSMFSYPNMSASFGNEISDSLMRHGSTPGGAGGGSEELGCETAFRESIKVTQRPITEFWSMAWNARAKSTADQAPRLLNLVQKTTQRAGNNVRVVSTELRAIISKVFAVG